METQYIFLFLISVLLLLFHSTAAGPVGICYGRLSDNHPSLPSIAALIKDNMIPNVRLFNTEPKTLSSFSTSGAALMIGVPDEVLPSLAKGDIAFSLRYLQTNIFVFINPSQLRDTLTWFCKYLSNMGNEIFLRDKFYATLLVPAIKNIYQALLSLNLTDMVNISSPLAASILSSLYPPSAGAFDPTFRSEMTPLLQFLRDINSPLMLHKNLQYISLDYALFRLAPIVYDQNLAYNNLYDATIDTFIYAMEKEGFFGIPLVVAETGWPTSGGTAASIENAAAYNRNVVTRTIRNIGTPKRPGVGVKVFLFDLFDEDKKAGKEYDQKHFGVFRVGGGKAYDIDFS